MPVSGNSVITPRPRCELQAGCRQPQPPLPIEQDAASVAGPFAYTLALSPAGPLSPAPIATSPGEGARAVEPHPAEPESAAPARRCSLRGAISRA